MQQYRLVLLLFSKLPLKTTIAMKNLLIICFVLISTFSSAQECNFFPSDTSICGFTIELDIIDDGMIEFDCSLDQVYATSIDNERTTFSFSECGIYNFYHTNTTGCIDTLMITIADPSLSVTSISTDISLSYGDIECPDNVTAGCDGEGSVSIDLPGINDPIWEFCTTASCISTRYTCSSIGDTIDCLVDSIACLDVTIMDESDAGCVATDQFSFIVLNTEGDSVDQNTFLEYIEQLQMSADISCPIIDTVCPSINNNESCSDSTVMDTIIYPIPVRLGGMWTLPVLPELELNDTTIFDFQNTSYELILSPSATFYGPGPLDVRLNEVTLTTSNDTIRSFPYGFDLELLWVEDWIVDTIQVIRELPYDPDGNCLPCGGNFFSNSFSLPGIPAFPCGAVSVSYPDLCQCDMINTEYNVSFLSCSPKSWLLEIDNNVIVDFVEGAEMDNNGNSIIISNPSQEEIIVHTSDYNGCPSIFEVFLEEAIDDIEVQINGPDVLTCLENFTSLEVVGLLNGNRQPLPNTIEWIMPNGNVENSSIIQTSIEGNYTVNYQDVHGCDYSASTFIGYVDISTTESEQAVLCGDESIVLYGEEINAPGFYEIEIDCSLTIEIDVFHFEIEEEFEFFNVCEGESQEVDGQLYSPGQYSIELPGNPCPSILNFTVEEIIFESNIEMQEDCDGRFALELSIDGDVGDISIYRNGDLFTQWTDQAFVEVLIEETDTYKVVFDVEGCIEMETLDLVVESNLPNVQLPDSVIINCNSLLDQIDRIDGLDYQWMTQDGDFVEFDDFTMETSGAYTLIVGNDLDCSVSSEIDIIVVEPLNVDITTTISCENTATGTLGFSNMSGGLAPFTYFLDDILIDDSFTSFGGEHTVTILQGDGCIYEEDIFIDTQFDLVVEEEQDLAFCNNAGVSIDITNDGSLSYEWLDGHDGISRTFTEGGSYDLRISDECSEGITTINVADNRVEQPFLVPNSIRIHSTSGNNTLTVTPLAEVLDYRLTVFGRFGNLIFQTTNISENWNGQFNGSPVVSGVYVWVLESTVLSCSGREEVVLEKGTVAVFD